ncbi:TIGR04222 domain-containing membrane protein [Dactylosporangium cerinum]|uniref:TIGR04222 domain-containing membrane protein n=1 Tax=Dactylosporangium cerinum TaxID=1434730 RepID=A0ABV9W027_9ACTN
MGALTGASNPLAVAGDAYVWIYAGLACCAIAGLLWWRRHNYTRGPAFQDLNPLQVALLNGGSDQAVAASLAALRVAGAVRVVDGSLRPDAVPHELASPLDLAVHDAVGRGHSPQSMSADPQVRLVIGGAGRVLIDTGLLLGARERRSVREATIPVFALALLGLLVGVFAPHDGGTVLGCAAVTAVAGALFLRVDRLPARTRAFLTRAREEAAFLSPAAGPDWTAHGPETAGLAVAMFGLEHLRSIDPELFALCTRWHGKPVEYGTAHPARSGSDLDESMYSGGPTGPIFWSETGGARDTWWGGTWGDGGSGHSDGGGGGGGDGGGGGG